MKKQCRPLLFIIINIVTIFNLLCYTSIRSMWSGIIRYTIEPMPYILLIIIAFCALLHTLLTINRKYPVFFAGVFVIVNLFFLALNGFIISLTLDASMYFIREFLYSGAFLLVIGIIFWAITSLYKHAIFQKKWFPTVLFLALLISGFCII